jgi:hypothetical protein
VKFPVYIDPGKRSYDAFDMQRGLFKVVNFSTWRRKAKTKKRGFYQAKGPYQGDPLQNGGVVIVAPGGELSYVHIEQESGDLADLDEVIASIPSST